MLEDAPGIYECFILSDTTDPEIALAEEVAYTELSKTVRGNVPVRYRRRTINHHRKSGNIRDFVMRWGGRYDHMIVFDADSYMERDTIVHLVEEMERAPHTALIQTIPQLVGGRTLLARWLRGTVVHRIFGGTTPSSESQLWPRLLDCRRCPAKRRLAARS